MTTLLQPVPPVDGGAIDDDLLTELALAADPDSDVADDAVSFWELNDGPLELLPSWYMPGRMGRVSTVRPWHRWTVGFLVVAFVGINAFGLCSTYGWVVAA
jgi:hypothetical protein